MLLSITFSIICTIATVVCFLGEYAFIVPVLLVFILIFAIFLGIQSLYASSRFFLVKGIIVVVCFPVSMILMGATVFQNSGLSKSVEGVKFFKPTDYEAIYFSIVTWTTLGYGDISPTESSQWMALFLAVSGYLFSGYLMAFVIKAVSEYESRDLG